MKLLHKNNMRGELFAPPDKSISHRGIIFGAISHGKTEIDGFLTGEDCLATVDAFRKMGIDIELNGTQVCVHGRGLKGLSRPDGPLYAANSGTTTRLLSGILAGQAFETTITGDPSLSKRPMKRIIEPLSQMGAYLMSSGGTLPLTIQGGKLHGIHYQMPVASAQVKSCIMLATLYADSPSVITEPYLSRNHTELMMQYFGGKVQTEGTSVTVSPVTALNAQKVTVCGDISSAAFFMAIPYVLPNSSITIKNVGLNPTRSGIIDVLTKMGANLKIENQRLTGYEPVGDITCISSDLKGTTIEGELIPRLIDEIPMIAVLAGFAQGTTVIRDAAELKVKESDRITCMATELSKAGIHVTPTDDGMIIEGSGQVKPAHFCHYNDHRIAMALSILALAGDCTMDEPDCVNISFPDFYQILNSL